MRTRIWLVLALLSAMIAPGASAKTDLIPVAPAGAGALASPNIELLGTIPDLGATGGRFAGGFFFTTSSSPMFFEPAPNSGLRIYDITNPEVPLLKGSLVLPHGENEDVDISVSRKLALISMDTLSEGQGLGAVAVGDKGPQYLPGDKLYVVSWADPASPKLAGTLVLPESVKGSKGTVGGPGHITACIADCKRYAYVTGAGDGSLFVIDLADPRHPQIASVIAPSAIKTRGVVHDVDIDRWGYAWLTGLSGTVMLDVRNPLRPKPVKWIADWENSHWNQFVHHNSTRLDSTTLLVTEEDWMQPRCKRDEDYAIGDFDLPRGEQGGFQTWRVNMTKSGNGTVNHLDQWVTELEQYGAGSNPITIFCSSHWFTVNRHRVASVAWYNQGVRFLDVSNPKSIRQVGYWLGPNATASAAYFVPGRDDVVYVADYTRGIDVLKIVGGGKGAKTVKAPIRAEWIGQGPVTFQPVTLGPSEQWGYACLTPRRAGRSG